MPRSSGARWFHRRRAPVPGDAHPAMAPSRHPMTLRSRRDSWRPSVAPASRWWRGKRDGSGLPSPSPPTSHWFLETCRPAPPMSPGTSAYAGGHRRSRPGDSTSTPSPSSAVRTASPARSQLGSRKLGGLPHIADRCACRTPRSSADAPWSGSPGTCGLRVYDPPSPRRGPGGSAEVRRMQAHPRAGAHYRLARPFDAPRRGDGA